MNKKGQMAGIGLILFTFIAVLVGVILFQAIAQNVGTMTDTVTLANETETAAANGESFYLTDYRSLSVTSITNGTTGDTIPESHYTVSNNEVYNSALAVKITVDDATYAEETWAINGVAQPLTYIPDSGGRAMAALIVIMFALAVVAVAMYPIYKGGLQDLLAR